MFTLSLPPPSLHDNNRDLTSALKHISLAPIPHSSRNILRAVALHATNPLFLTALTQIHSPTELTYLATLCRRALIAFRNRGGRPTTVGTREGSGFSTPATDPAGPPHALNQLHLSANHPDLALLTSICTFFSLSSPSTLLPPWPSTSRPRPCGFSGIIKDRDPDQPAKCLITGSSRNLAGAHILPHSLVKIHESPTPGQCAWWMFLVFFLGIESRDELWRLLSSAREENSDREENGAGVVDEQPGEVAGGSGYDCRNGLCLQEGIHRSFDTGMLTLEPVEYEGGTGRGRLMEEMRVIFKWHDTQSELSLVTTLLPHTSLESNTNSPHTQTDAHRGESRPVSDGDVFIIKTCDTHVYPLPIPGFLQLHDVLWRAIGAAGLTDDSSGTQDNKVKQPGRKRRRRLPANEKDGARDIIGIAGYPTPGEGETTAQSLAQGVDHPAGNNTSLHHTTHSQQRSVSGLSVLSGSSDSTSSSIFDTVEGTQDSDHGTIAAQKTRPRPRPHRPSASPSPNQEDKTTSDLGLAIPKKRKHGGDQCAIPTMATSETQGDYGKYDNTQEENPLGPARACDPHNPNCAVSDDSTALGEGLGDIDSERRLDMAIQLLMPFFPHFNYAKPSIRDAGAPAATENGEEDEYEYDTESSGWWDAEDAEDAEDKDVRRFDDALRALIVGL